MLTITIKANVPAADAQGIKERIAMDNAHIAALQQEIEKLRGQLPRWMPLPEPPEAKKALEAMKDGC